jgi:hypothetical protein
MRVAVDRIDLSTLSLDLGTLGKVNIASGRALSGALDRTEERLALEGFGAEEIVLAGLRLALGAVTLGNEAGATLAHLALALEQSGGALTVDVGAQTIAANDLLIDAGGVSIRGRPALGNAKLTLRPDGGGLFAESLEATELVVKVAGGLTIEAPNLKAEGLRIGWGDRGFELAAEKVEAPGLTMRGGTLAVDAGGVLVTKVDVGGRGVRVGYVSLARGALRAKLAPAASEDAEPPPAGPPRAEARPLLDWRVLDFVSGKIDVDALVDVIVPILGQRNATHQFRIPIENGTIDYRELEADLAYLEDAVLDFAVRDGALALERVNPLLPVRGRGKPIVFWELDRAGLALAEKNRVRLSVLPLAKPAQSGSTPPPRDEGAKSSSFALRKLVLHRIDAKLSLSLVTAPSKARIVPRRVDELLVEGSVAHTPDPSSPEGKILGNARNVALEVHSLEIGDQLLDAPAIAIAKLNRFEVCFADITPTAVALDVADVIVERLTLRPA